MSPQQPPDDASVRRRRRMRRCGFAPSRRPHRAGAALALGKPNPLVNEFYRRAVRDPKIELRIFTALSLRKPSANNELERRFLEPFVARVFGNYPNSTTSLLCAPERYPPISR